MLISRTTYLKMTNKKKIPKKVLLIGGNGFIGSHLVDNLMANDIPVRVWDKRPEMFRQPLPEVEYLYEEIVNTNCLEEAINGCDTIIYLVHSTVPANSLNSPGQELFDSVRPFVTLLQYVGKSSVEQFVYFSSGGTVYGRPKQLPVPEEHPLNPISPYGVAKVAMEKYLHMFCGLYNKKHLVIRPSNPYGPRQDYNGNQGVIPIFMNKILHDDPITLWGNGAIKKDYIFVEDLARATVKLLLKGVVDQTFNIGSGIGLSLYELISQVEMVTGKKAAMITKKAAVTDVQHIVLDCTKIRSTIGENLSLTSLAEGMKVTHRWLLND